MAPLYRPKPVKAGDPLTANAWNRMQESIRDSMRVRAGAGLSVRAGAGGLAIASLASGAQVVVGVASGNIPPRAGSTAGLGVITLATVEASGAIVSTGESLDVVNVSITEMAAGVGIKTGLYCMAVLIGDAWHVSPLECG